MQRSPEFSPLTSAMEDYLEAIYHLEADQRIARVRDIAKRLGVKMSSVTSALKHLSSRNLVRYDPHQYITLTDQGLIKAKEVVRRHEVIKRFLARVLQVQDELAEESACQMEHHLEPEVMDKLIAFLEFVEMCPVDQTRWIDDRSSGCDDCASCLAEAARKVAEREKAQQVALAEGMTLAEAALDATVMIEDVKGPVRFRNAMSTKGLKPGIIAEIEARDDRKHSLKLNVRGYHVAVDETEASRILIKPL